MAIDLQSEDPPETYQALAPEAYYRSLVDDVPDIVAACSCDGTLSFLNLAFEKVTGWDREAWLGQPLFDLVHPADFPALRRRFQTVLGEPSSVLEIRMQRADGSYFLGEAVVSQQMRGKSVVGVLATVRDVTEKKRIEAELSRKERDAENRCHLFAVPTQMGIFCTDAGGKVLAVNPCWSEISGLPMEKAKGEGWAAALHPEDRDRVVSQWIRSVERGEELLCEFRFLTPSGDVRWVHGTSLPLRSDSGAITGYFGIIVDASERKRLEEKLQQSEGRLRLALESASIGTWDWVFKDPSIQASATTRQLFGWDEKCEISYELFLSSLHPQDRERINKSVEKALDPDSDGHFNLEYRLKPPAGAGERWLSSLGRVIFDAEGKAERFVGIVLDITGRKSAEETLKRRAEELARSNAELEQFAYVSAHDLKEPLRMIKTYVQLLDRMYRERLGPDAQEFMGFVVEGTTRMHELIDALLVYSEVGRIGGGFVDTDCNQVARVAVSRLDAAIAQAGAEVEVQPLPCVHGDPTLLVQLFQNLIANSLKFRNEGAPRIQISAKRMGGDWLFQIKDNGIGIEPEYAQRIFVMFKRLHGRREYPGTGIGLAICKKIIEQHKGRIWVESEPGCGATFLFTVPISED